MATGVPSRNDWIFGKCNLIDDKEQLLHANILQMLNKSITIFKYNGLPDTIKAKDLETYNQVGGYSIWKDVKDDLYVFQGGLGGAPSPYYLPTIATVANPALNYTKDLIIDKECVVMLNDYYYQGLMPLFNKYGSLLVEAELSLKIAIINTRVPELVQADNDNTHKSAEEFFKNVIGGKFGVIASKEFFEGIKSVDFCKQSYITSIIEAIQYIKGSWYNEIGLNAAYNMKREALNESEVDINDDILQPTIDTMLECRQAALERVNKMFGTNITVELNSVWKQNKKAEEIALEKDEAELDSMNQGEDSEDGNENETDRDTDDDTAD